MKVTILGATTNPQRYAYLAAERLVGHGHEIFPVGKKKGDVFGKEIMDTPPQEDMDVATLYISAKWQEGYRDYLSSGRVKHVIFNPGTENPDMYRLLEKNGVSYENACTLVMLAAGTFERKS